MILMNASFSEELGQILPDEGDSEGGSDKSDGKEISDSGESCLQNTGMPSLETFKEPLENMIQSLSSLL